MRLEVLWAGIVLATAPALSTAQPAAAPRHGFTIALGGDMIGPYRRLDVTATTFQPVARLFQQADVGFANQEGSIFDMEGFAGYPAAENGGGYPRQVAAAAFDLRAMGITLVSKANNHATDWGAEGLVASLESLAAAGVTQAGSGRSLTEARAPAYVSTPAGAAALVSAASTFTPMSVAGPAVQRQGVTSRFRPGISALHLREVRLVSQDQLAEIGAMVGQPPSSQAEVRVGDEIFRASRERGHLWEMDNSDRAAVLDAVRQARLHARFVIFTIHAHETAGHDDVPGPVDYQPLVLHRADEAPSPDDPRPAAFETDLFHAAVDAGADVVVRTGPHVIGGVEIYKGKPIFYGLGSLFFDFGASRSYTTPAGERLTFPDAWFETVVALCDFKHGKLQEVRLHPMTIESSNASTSGLPRLAEAGTGRHILQRLKSQSAAFGVPISIDGDVGVIRPR